MSQQRLRTPHAMTVTRTSPIQNAPPLRRNGLLGFARRNVSQPSLGSFSARTASTSMRYPAISVMRVRAAHARQAPSRAKSIGIARTIEGRDIGGVFETEAMNHA